MPKLKPFWSQVHKNPCKIEHENEKAKTAGKCNKNHSMDGKKTNFLRQIQNNHVQTRNIIIFKALRYIVLWSIETDGCTRNMVTERICSDDAKLENLNNNSSTIQWDWLSSAFSINFRPMKINDFVRFLNNANTSTHHYTFLATIRLQVAFLSGKMRCLFSIVSFPFILFYNMVVWHNGRWLFYVLWSV